MAAVTPGPGIHTLPDMNEVTCARRTSPVSYPRLRMTTREPWLREQADAVQKAHEEKHNSAGIRERLLARRTAET